MLAQTLGPGKAQVLVYANMNVDQTTKESLEYAKAGTPLQQTKSLETLTGNGSGAAATGTANLPAAAQSGGKSNYKKETSTPAERRLEDRHPLDGRARHGRKPARLGAARPLRPGLGGPGDQGSGHERRGDQRQARRHDLDRPDRVRERRCDGRSGLRRDDRATRSTSLLAIAAAVFLFFTTRSLRKREQETIPEPRWLRELEAPVRLSELEREMAPARAS